MNQTGTFHFQPGTPRPLGATITNGGVNFSIFSHHEESMTLVLFHNDFLEPVAEQVLDPEKNRTGDIWHIHVDGVDERVQYAYRADGPYEPEKTGHMFNGETLLLDPYARAIAGTALCWGG